MTRFHACATCIHYRQQKTNDGMHRYCQRLGYETKLRVLIVHYFTKKYRII